MYLFSKVCITLFFVVTIFEMSNLSASAKENSLEPKIIDIKTSPVSIVNQWVILRQRSSGELLIQVEAKNVKEIKFWTVPVKNKSWQDSWENRKLISVDNNGEDGWSSVFYYGQENILSFIIVEVIGHNGKTDKSPFYVAYRK